MILIHFFYIDQWYRCAVIKVFKKECEVMLLDFGNIEMISKKDLRKPHDQFTKIPTLAVSCQLVGKFRIIHSSQINYFFRLATSPRH